MKALQGGRSSILNPITWLLLFAFNSNASLFIVSACLFEKEFLYIVLVFLKLINVNQTVLELREILLPLPSECWLLNA